MSKAQGGYFEAHANDEVNQQGRQLSLMEELEERALDTLQTGTGKGR